MLSPVALGARIQASEERQQIEQYASILEKAAKARRKLRDWRAELLAPADALDKMRQKADEIAKLAAADIDGVKKPDAERMRLCAHVSFGLLLFHWNVPPTITADVGAWPQMTQAIYEVSTRKPASESGALRACQACIRRFRSDFDLYQQPEMRDIMRRARARERIGSAEEQKTFFAWWLQDQ